MSDDAVYCNGFHGCARCDGEGEILTCPDDICHGLGECMHGDGMDPCPDCDGTGDVVCDGCDPESGSRLDPPPRGRRSAVTLRRWCCRMIRAAAKAEARCYQGRRRGEIVMVCRRCRKPWSCRRGWRTWHRPRCRGRLVRLEGAALPDLVRFAGKAKAWAMRHAPWALRGLVEGA